MSEAWQVGREARVLVSEIAGVGQRVRESGEFELVLGRVPATGGIIELSNETFVIQILRY
eukprot:scaffold82023_cov57-Phaeocystis_antarctica.AAC.1